MEKMAAFCFFAFHFIIRRFAFLCIVGVVPYVCLDTLVSYQLDSLREVHIHNLSRGVVVTCRHYTSIYTF